MRRGSVNWCCCLFVFSGKLYVRVKVVVVACRGNTEYSKMTFCR